MHLSFWVGGADKVPDLSGSPVSWLLIHTSFCHTSCPSRYLRSSSFLHHICTTLNNMPLQGVGIPGIYCLNIAHDISSDPEPCCFPQPCSGKVAPGFTVSQVSSLFWVLDLRPKSMGRRVFREEVILYCSLLTKSYAYPVQTP